MQPDRDVGGYRAGNQPVWKDQVEEGVVKILANKEWHPQDAGVQKMTLW